MMLCIEKTSCRLCHSKDLWQFFDMGYSPIGEQFHLEANQQEQYPVRLKRCAQCGQIQLSHVVSKNTIYQGNYLYQTTRSLGLDRHFELYATTIAKLPDLTLGNLIIDIGSNVGTFLSSLQRRNFTVLGIEPAEQAARIANENGINTLCSFFDDACVASLLSQKKKAQAITINNAFANIDDLDGLMQNISNALANDGWLIIETGYGLDLVKNFVMDNIYHEHISYFLLTPLYIFFKKYGFEICKAERTATKGGSLRVYVRRKEYAKELPWDVESLMILENELGFNSTKPFQAFTDIAEHKKKQIVQAIADFAAEPCAAFGTAVGCTALLYWLEAGQHFKYLVDDNPIMHGRFSPGYNIEVLSPENFRKTGIKRIVNLAWRYISAIYARHPYFIQNDNKILTILPDIEQV